MSEIASASINSFGTAPEADHVPTSEESAFVLTSSQLSALITQAVEKAIQPLQDEVSQLRSTVATQDEKIAALEATQDTQADNSLIQLRLINDLREAAREEPTAGLRDRVDILRALVAANGGKMLAKDARVKMHLKKNQFSLVLAAAKNCIDIKPLHSDKRKLILCQISSREP
jgi:hypothetical protein